MVYNYHCSFLIITFLTDLQKSIKKSPSPKNTGGQTENFCRKSFITTILVGFVTSNYNDFGRLRKPLLNEFLCWLSTLAFKKTPMIRIFAVFLMTTTFMSVVDPGLQKDLQDKDFYRLPCDYNFKCSSH